MSDYAIKLAIFVGYVLILWVIGAVASRRMKDVRDYFAGGKKLGFLSVAFSSRATGESAWLLLGLTGMGAFIGVKAFWIVIGEIVGVSLAWLFMVRRFKRLTDRYDSITIPDYLESRFKDSSHSLRLIAVIPLVVFVAIYVSAQIHATGNGFNDFLGWNYYVGALVGFAVVLVYIFSGGFVAVVWSDVFQGTLMLLGLVALPIAGLIHLGGWGGMMETLRSIDPNLVSITGNDTTMLGIAGILGFIFIGLGFLGSPQVFVRFIALKDEHEITKGTAVAITWTVLALSGAVLAGMVGRAILSGGDLAATWTSASDWESVLPVTTAEIFPPLVAGLYVAIVLSATMSTIDSLLIVAGSAAVRDYYQKILHPGLGDEKLVFASRMATLVLAFVALAIAMGVAIFSGEKGVFWYIIFGWSGIAATFCPVMILSLFWSGITARGAKAAMLTGFFMVPILQFGVMKMPGIGELVTAIDVLGPAFAMSLIAGVLVSLTDPKGRARLDEAESDLDFAKNGPDKSA